MDRRQDGWDDARQSEITTHTDGFADDAVSTFTYKNNGHVDHVLIDDGDARTVTYITDAAATWRAKRSAWPLAQGGLTCPDSISITL